jgi:TRAP-type C4-dicarboxylate transport system permease small subunit
MPVPHLIVNRINRLVELVVVIQFAVLVIVVTAAVFARYVLNDSIVWAEELARYLFVWLSFLGGGLGVGSNIHVGVDSLVELMPGRVKAAVQILMELMIVAFTLVLIWAGAEFAAFGMRTEALLIPIPMGYVYLAVPVGGFVMLINVLVHLHRHVLALSRGEAR